MNMKSVSISHLVFGLIFLGVTSLWVVGATTDLEAPALAIWGPVVLIAAGLVGLAATIFNARNARAETEAAAAVRAHTHADDTVAVDQEEQS
jgi:hypothetical protein